jgi:RNA polymerase sigma-70 factor (ECF subfamily)
VDARSKLVEEQHSGEESREFESLFEQHYPAIYRAIVRIVGDPSCAEELAIDVFLTLLRNPQIQSEKVGGWLFRTAVHRAIYELRRRARYARYSQFFRVGTTPANPEEIHAAAEEQQNVRKVLAALKPRHSELLLLRADGFSYDELAALLHLSPASIGALIVRAQKAFRKEYTRHYGEPRNRN